eukprot:2077321-Prymnesium_polylepis.1
MACGAPGGRCRALRTPCGASGTRYLYGVNVLRETDGTVGTGETATHTRGLRFVRPSGHAGSCIARRPAFSHGARPTPAPPSRAARRRL